MYQHWNYITRRAQIFYIAWKIPCFVTVGCTNNSFDLPYETYMHDLSKGYVVFAVEYSSHNFYIDSSREEIRKQLLRFHKWVFYKTLEVLKLIFYCKILFQNCPRKYEIMNKLQSWILLHTTVALWRLTDWSE